jgi:hypothetical protein
VDSAFLEYKKVAGGIRGQDRFKYVAYLCRTACSREEPVSGIPLAFPKGGVSIDLVALDQTTFGEVAVMGEIVGSLLEGLIRYCFLGVAFALLLMFSVLLLLQVRDCIMNVLKTEILRMSFEKLFALSDRLHEKYVQDNIYGSAMWLTPLLWIGLGSTVGLLILLIVVKATLG